MPQSNLQASQAQTPWCGELVFSVRIRALPPEGATARGMPLPPSLAAWAWVNRDWCSTSGSQYLLRLLGRPAPGTLQGMAHKQNPVKMTSPAPINCRRADADKGLCPEDDEGRMCTARRVTAAGRCKRRREGVIVHE